MVLATRVMGLPKHSTIFFTTEAAVQIMSNVHMNLTFLTESKCFNHELLEPKF